MIECRLAMNSQDWLLGQSDHQCIYTGLECWRRIYHSGGRKGVNW